MQSTLTLSALVCALAVAAPAAAQVGTFTASGSGVPSNAADTDGSLSGGSVSIATGRDSKLGRFTAQAAGDLGDWDGSSFCNFDDNGIPSGVELPYLSLSQVVAYKHGQVFYEMASSPPSTLCFNFVDGVSFTFEVYMDVTGGSRRFEGATGWSVSRGSGKGLRQMSAFQSAGEGKVVTPAGPEDDDD